VGHTLGAVEQVIGIAWGQLLSVGIVALYGRFSARFTQVARLTPEPPAYSQTPSSSLAVIVAVPVQPASAPVGPRLVRRPGLARLDLVPLS